MGGLGGHMSHVYENMQMTFTDFLNLFQGVSSGIIPVTEKVDGQNLFFTYDHSLRIPKFARNATKHARVGGLTRQELTNEFIAKGAGDPGYQSVINAFDNGMMAIENAFASIDPMLIKQIFYEPNIYVNCEVMSGDNDNIVVFNGNFIVFHGMKIVDENFDPHEMSDEDITELDMRLRKAFSMLVSEIERQELQIAQQEWKVVGPAIIKLSDLSGTDFMDRLEAAVDLIIGSTQLTFRHRFIDFVAVFLKKTITDTFAVMPTQEVFDMILTLVTETKDEKKQRIKSGRKIDLRTLKAMHRNDGDYNALRNIASSQNAKSILGIILEPFAQLVAHFSSEILSGAASNFAANPVQAQNILKRATDLAIQDMPNQINRIIQLGDTRRAESVRRRFDKNMARLKNLENVSTGIEGVVFEYPPMSNRYYKFTGGFAAANQILGLVGFKEKGDYLAQAKSEY